MNVYIKSAFIKTRELFGIPSNRIPVPQGIETIKVRLGKSSKIMYRVFHLKISRKIHEILHLKFDESFWDSRWDILNYEQKLRQMTSNVTNYWTKVILNRITEIRV